MLKNRILVAFAFVGLAGFAACADNEPDVIEEPVVEEPINDPALEPAPAPVMTDTTGLETDTGFDTVGTMGADTVR